jgi:hypothetical protein
MLEIYFLRTNCIMKMRFTLGVVTLVLIAGELAGCASLNKNSEVMIDTSTRKKETVIGQGQPGPAMPLGPMSLGSR